MKCVFIPLYIQNDFYQRNKYLSCSCDACGYLLLIYSNILHFNEKDVYKLGGKIESILSRIPPNPLTLSVHILFGKHRILYLVQESIC